MASGDLEERQIAALVAAGAPIDLFGVGTELGTSRDAPALGGVYKLVADRPPDDGWHGVAKRSPAKATLPGPKQVFRRFADGVMVGDEIAEAGEDRPGRPLLVPAMRAGRPVTEPTLAEHRAVAAANLRALPAAMRLPNGAPAAYPVRLSPRLRRHAPAGAP